jgi:DNA-binding beta-propeller fold protein YncE
VAGWRAPARARAPGPRSLPTSPGVRARRPDCAATIQAVGDAQVPGGHPDDIAVNAATDTIYVATLTSSGPDLVSVFDGATCNATSTSGCGQTPTTIAAGASGDRFGNSTLNLAVNQATNTIYASNVFNIDQFSPQPFLGNSVYAIDGATCDAANTTGCGQAPGTVTLASNPPVGSNPLAIAVDQATDTIYTANIADGRASRHRFGDQRHDVQRPRHQRVRPDPRHRPRRLRRERHRHRP